MYLKSLTLKGFKTFADKTTLEFSPQGITCIVGPNGCGKSNIVDSLRFVLGELSLKDLRSSSLEELIFAGTAMRKSISLAEVTADFDNSDSSLALAYNEVSVKRRIYRSGESEFFINRDAVRLKDIRDLFLGTGLGGGSYAIINQGQVDVILSSKPEERRAPFEEAAEISKYKGRKEAAERKLIATEQNLLRIADLKNEIGGQLSILEEQAKKATEYKVIKDSLKNLEIGLSRKQIINLTERKKALEEKVSSLREKAAKSFEETKKEEEKREAIRISLRDLENEIETNSQKLKDAIFEKEREVAEEKNKLIENEENQRFIAHEISHDEKYLQKLEGLRLSLKGGVKEAVKLRIEIEEIISAWRKGESKYEDILGILLVKDESNIEAFDSELKKTSLHSKVKVMPLEIEEPQDSPEVKRIEDEIGLVQESLTLRRKEEKQIEEKMPPLKTKIEHLEGELNSLKESLGSMFEQARDLRASLEREIESLEGALKGEEEVERALREELGKAEVNLAKVEVELASYEQRMSEEYGIGIEEVLKTEIEIENVAKSKAEAGELRNKMLAMEPVNLLAIEEFEKTKERVSFIETQYSDLDIARENLRNLISELDKKAKESFLAVIEVVCANFKEIFSGLFMGGEATLKLEEGKDPLSAGIEIMVRPNGRKWLPLQLLSGGEKALTAIAILFALLRTHKAPFCFLDEVDAALDDANIYRFTKMLKDFSSGTQMIVITHNKRTMAEAGTLYGITMEEPGVSKLISMRLASEGAELREAVGAGAR